jgi:hypothetical protein
MEVFVEAGVSHDSAGRHENEKARQANAGLFFLLSRAISWP